MGVTAVTNNETRCPGCGESVTPGDRFCETCGRPLLVLRTPAGGPDDRNRVEWDLGAVAGVSDRGNRRARNEDSMAFGVVSSAATRYEGAGTATVVAVVCDGVATSDRSERASQAAVDSAVAALIDAVLTTPHGPLPTEVAIAAMRGAVGDALAATAALGDPDDPDTSPSCTFVSAVVTPAAITVGWVGDSRAYWLAAPDTVGPSRRLTADDTLATELIAAGVPADVANAAPQAHSLSKWLGADAGDVQPRIATLRPDGPGLLLLCSDGLWNYLPKPAELADTVYRTRGALPLVAAQTVSRALELGGHDNITCVLVPIPLDEGRDP